MAEWNRRAPRLFVVSLKLGMREQTPYSVESLGILCWNLQREIANTHIRVHKSAL